MKKLLMIAFLAMASRSAVAQTQQQMIVRIDGLRDTVGQTMIFVYNNEDDFPTKRDRAFKAKKVPVTATSQVVSFSDVPSGTYGVAVYHDENMNDKMDRSWYGMPKEGYGASNDATGTFGPPKFKDAKFDFQRTQDTIKIIIHY